MYRTECSKVRTLCLKRMPVSNPSPEDSWNSTEEKASKSLRARRDEELLENKAF